MQKSCQRYFVNVQPLLVSALSLSCNADMLFTFSFLDAEAGALDNIVTTVSSEERDQS